MKKVYTNGAERTAVFFIRDAEGRLYGKHHRKGAGEEKRVWWSEHEGAGIDTGAFPFYGAEHSGEWDPDELVIVGEGEVVRDALDAAGFAALGTLGTAHLPADKFFEILRERRVVIWPDGDEPGRKHAERIAEKAAGVAAEVLVYTWHEAPKDVKGPDAADHPAVQSRDRKALGKLLTDLESAPRWRPPATRRTRTAAELLARDIPPARWAVPDMLPEGVTLLAGKPKLGKSWLSLGLCVATATGGYALGKKRVEKGEALYLGLEDHDRRMQKRLRKLLGHHGPPEDLHIAMEWPRLSEGGADELRAWLNEHPDTRLVVIDTLAKIRKPARGQNVYAEDYEALEKLLPLAAEYRVAVVVVHHLRKLSAADPLDEISGSTGLSGGVDGFLILKRDRGRHDATLHVDGRDVEEPSELALKWDAELASWTLMGDAEEYRMTQDRAEIIDVLRYSPKPMTPKEVAASLGKKPENVGQRLYQMLQAGQVVSPDRGLYTIHKDDKDDKDGASLSFAEADKEADKDESGTGKGDSADLTDLTNLIGGEENGPVRALLAHPPPWLEGQLAEYRKDPARHAEPTCVAVAAHLFDEGEFDSADRWREVLPVLEEIR